MGFELRKDKSLSESGELVEEATRVALAKFLAGFVAFVEATRRKAGWSAVKDYFLVRVGSLLVPPAGRLEIQKREIGVTPS